MRIVSRMALLALVASPAATWIGAGAGAGLSAGCLPPLACTLVGYENGLQVDLDVPDAPATYRVEVEADGEVLALEYELTLASELAQCLGECIATGERLRLDDSFPKDGLGMAVNIGRTDNEGGPRSATVRVFRGDALVAEATFEPRYETDEPNGRGCGEHVFASADLVVP